MGKKLDALLRRSFRSSKFISLVRLAISRLLIMLNHRKVLQSQSVSDVSELLRLGHHHTAFLRIDHLIKDRNMSHALLLLQGYFHLLIDRVYLIELHSKECPDELREAISSLFFAASRIGDFTELQQIRALLTSRYGTHFIDQHTNCAVNPNIVQTLSTKPPTKELRLKVLEEIAAEINVVLKLDEVSTSTQRRSAHSDVSTKSELVGGRGLTVEETVEDYGLVDSNEIKKKYKDVTDAAQAAFESAAYAAAAARAAVVLSQSDVHGPDDYDNRSNVQKKRSFQEDKSESEHEQESKCIPRAEGWSQADSNMDSEEVIRKVEADSNMDSEEVIRKVEADSNMDSEEVIRKVQADSNMDSEEVIREVEADSNMDSEEVIREVEADSNMDAEEVIRKVEADSNMDAEEVIRKVKADSNMDSEEVIKKVEADSMVSNDSEGATQSSTKATEVKDEQHMVWSANHRAGVKGAVSVRTRQVRGYR